MGLPTPTLEKQVAILKRQLARNAQARVHFSSDPRKWETSETSLHEATVHLSNVAATPERYAALVSCGGVEALVHVLAHPNIDIVSAALCTLAELNDMEGEAVVDNYLGLHQNLVATGAFEATVDAILEHTSKDALSKDDGVHEVLAHGLQFIDHACELRSNDTFGIPITKRLTQLLVSLLQTSEQEPNPKETPNDPLNDNLPPTIARIVETLALLLHDASEASSAFVESDGIRALISCARLHSTKKGAEAVEAARNVLAVLCDVLLNCRIGKSKFVDGNGVETMVEFARNHTALRHGSMKVLDFACLACEVAVLRAFSAGALGVLFAVLAKFRRDKDYSSNDSEHILSILFSMFRYANVDARDRLLFKFWASGGARIDTLLTFYTRCAHQIRAIDENHSQYLMTGVGGSSLRNIADPEEADNAYLQRLDAGLFMLQLTGVIITHLLVYTPDENIGALREGMKDYGVHEQGVLNSVQEYTDSIEAADGSDEALRNRAVEQKRLRSLVKVAKSRRNSYTESN